MDNHFYSIVIPVKEVNDYVRESLGRILNLKESNYEILLMPNNHQVDEWESIKLKIVPTGRVGPGEKRDIAAKIAIGTILIFLDDDSYPAPDFLEKATKYFSNERVIAIGGPGITPNDDTAWQKASGAVYESKITGGFPERYLKIQPQKEINDWPSVNFMVRKQNFLNVGGFNTKYWPGEDTELCLKLREFDQGIIIYAPDVVVWHHRRKTLTGHLKQAAAYGLHRGFFSGKFKETSKSIKYWIPTIFSAYCLTLIGLFLQGGAANPYFFLPIFFYIGVVIYASIVAMIRHGIITALLLPTYVFATHMVYGLNFLIGYFKTSLESKLR